MTRKLSLCIALLVFTWRATAQGADPVYPDRPKDIRVTGTMLAATERPSEDLVTVSIFLGDAARFFRVGEIEDLSADEKDRAVKEGILIRQVRFYGPDELVHRLEQPDIVGKVVTIEGRLDVQERRFLIKSIKEASGEEILSPTKQH
jgi:hypothetical protein